MRTFKLKKCKRVHGIHFTPDGSQLLAVGGATVDMVDTAVWLDLATGETVGRIDQLGQCYAVDPQLTRLVLGGANQWEGIAEVQWTALPEGRKWHPLPGETRARNKAAVFQHVFGLAVEPSGALLAVGNGRQFRRTADLGVYEWEMEVAVLRFDPPEIVKRIPMSDGAGALAINHDATRLAVTGGPEGEPEVRVSEWPSGKFLHRYLPPGTRSRCLLFLPDGRLVFSNARNVYILPTDTPEPQFVLGRHKGQVNALAATEDGRRVLSASHDGLIRVWDAESGKVVTSFDWKIGPVTAVAFAPDGLTCAAAGKSGQVVIWDVDV
jgi:WD40 repeat protein